MTGRGVGGWVKNDTYAHMKAPIVRGFSWPGLFVSMIPFGALLALNHAFWPRYFPIIAVASWIFLVFGMRRIFTGSHRRGLALVKKGDFSGAIPLFQASYDEMVARPWIDRFRWLLLGSASCWSYREMALCNCGFCFSQIGESHKMEECYRKALAEFPQSVLANTAIRMLETLRKN